MQLEPGKDIRNWTRRVFVSLMALSLLVWSLAPSFSHQTDFLLTEARAEAVHDDHGHSHGDSVDRYWSWHGHSHDVADHDHSSAILIRNGSALPVTEYRLAGVLDPFVDPPNPVYRLERPPRV